MFLKQTIRIRAPFRLKRAVRFNVYKYVKNQKIIKKTNAIKFFECAHLY